MLFGQLQDGLKLSIMKSPAVSGCQSYKDLRMAAKNEKKLLVELCHRQPYQKAHAFHNNPRKSDDSTNRQLQDSTHHSGPGSRVFKCYKCGSTDHLQKHCKLAKRESTNRENPHHKSAGAKMVHSSSTKKDSSAADPMQYLESGEEATNGVRTVSVKDRGSRAMTALVSIQGVEARGIVDTGADITIMGPELFKKVTAVAHLKKS